MVVDQIFGGSGTVPRGSVVFGLSVSDAPMDFVGLAACVRPMNFELVNIVARRKRLASEAMITRGEGVARSSLMPADGLLIPSTNR